MLSLTQSTTTHNLRTTTYHYLINVTANATQGESDATQGEIEAPMVLITDTAPAISPALVP
jgi:hypothetical protein